MHRYGPVVHHHRVRYRNNLALFIRGHDPTSFPAGEYRRPDRGYVLDVMGFDDVATALDAVTNANATTGALDFLADHWSPLVREVVAARLDTPPNTLAILASDPSQYVRWRAAQHPHLPLDALSNLLFDPSPRVRDAARANRQFPLLPPETQVEVALSL